MLLHLELDVVQCHLEVGCHLLPLLLFLPRTLDTLLLREEGRDTSASVLEQTAQTWDAQNTPSLPPLLPSMRKSLRAFPLPFSRDIS